MQLGNPENAGKNNKEHNINYNNFAIQPRFALQIAAGRPETRARRRLSNSFSSIL